MIHPACLFLNCPTSALPSTYSTHEAYKQREDDEVGYGEASNQDVIRQFSMYTIVYSAIIEPQDFQRRRLTG